MLTFKPLRVLLAERDIKRMDFIKDVGISSGTAAKLWKDEYVSLEVIDRICEALDCEVHEVVERKK
ncbi:helix-turn-helix transcriptional regulator [Siminovitchia sp. FSL W7-1587]|uniref:helix-turn-helix domain-containing protein n=1 Tax=Siminovitchia sp. FSL W7-1587 TaxID=2954699 RepID=UPI0030D42795